MRGYDDRPSVKAPNWHGLVVADILFNNLCTGLFVIAALGDLAAPVRFGDTARVAYPVALALLLLDMPLLIADLGQPARFHHMLRVFKPSSPMNLGAWTLLTYSLPATVQAARQLVGDSPAFSKTVRESVQLIPARAVAAIGLLPALTMLSYPGVLLSTTSTPVWAKSKFLGAVFACSSISAGAATISLHLMLHGGGNQKALRRIERIERLAALGEGASLAAYLITSGEAAKPLTSGGYKWHFWAGAVGAGLVLPELLRVFAPKKKKKKRLAGILSSALSLAGSLALKWAVTYAGRESAMDAGVAHRMASSTEI